MDSMYRIGEVSKFFNIPVQTLRFYEQEGLFIPAKTDEATGYRYYSWLQFERLRLIIFLRELGLPIKTIREQLNMPHEEEYIRLLEGYRDVLQSRIDEDAARKKFIDEKISFIRMANTLPQNQVLFLYFAEQRVCRYDKPITNFRDHEIAVVEFINKYHLRPGISRIGQLFSPGKLTSGGEIVSTSMYVMEEMCTKNSFELPDLYRDVFPAGVYATMFYQRRTEDTLPFIDELLHEVKKHSFMPRSDVIRSIVFDIGDCEHKDSGYLACIRVLVSET